MRLAGRTDMDGQFWIGERRVPPYRLPLAHHTATLGRLGPDAVFVWDPELGWTLRAGAVRDGVPWTDSLGARGTGPRAERAAPGVLRIATFGDSFTFGDEVEAGEAWPAVLGELLAARGVATEVLNFGVSAYGLDQAWLRFERDARVLEPDLVILGLQPENLLRNLNVIRPLYFAETGVPYSKPRFVLDDDGLRLVNQPTLPPAELPALLADPAASPLARYERFLAPQYRVRWWQRSRLLALLAEALGSKARNLPGFALDPEMSELGRRIVLGFARSAKQSGAAFLVVHLPRRQEIEEYEAGREPWHEPFLRTTFAEGASVGRLIRPEGRFSPISDSDFQPRGHYGPRLHREVAASLVEPVLELVAARRFEAGARPVP